VFFCVCVCFNKIQPVDALSCVIDTIIPKQIQAYRIISKFKHIVSTSQASQNYIVLEVLALFLISQTLAVQLKIVKWRGCTFKGAHRTVMHGEERPAKKAESVGRVCVCVCVFACVCMHI
jgi:hypothetical protein